MSAVEIEAEQHALYRFFDDGGALLYVGISMNPPARWAQHRSGRPWWSEVATVSLEMHPSRTAVEYAERVAIRSEMPRYNVAHHPDHDLRREPVIHDGPYYGAAEVAEILGVSRQRVTQLTARPDFPAPVAVLAMGKVWTRDDVQEWADERDRRLGRLT